MAYQIYLSDKSNSVELDCEGVDMSTTFSVADIKDISARADTITKEISFKGTKTNNEAFGSMFHLNKVSDTDLSNKLFFNYNPLVLVDCLVYEDGMLLLQGNLRVLEVTINKGAILYGTVITGTFIAFKGIIGDKVLYNENDNWTISDTSGNKGLNFTDLKHHYSKENIVGSWGAVNSTYDNTNIEVNTNSTQPFQLGSGYVYPFIDYGQLFKTKDSDYGQPDGTTDADPNVFNILNFRPAIYVNEILKRIFQQKDLNGWSYELKGDEGFQKKFSSLIVPYSDEKLQYKFNTDPENGYTFKFTKPSGITNTKSDLTVNGTHGSHLLCNLVDASTSSSDSIIKPIQLDTVTNKLLKLNRNFTANGSLTVEISSLTNTSSNPFAFHIQLASITTGADVNVYNNWSFIAEKVFLVTGNTSSETVTTTVTIPEKTEFVSNKDLAVRIYVENVTGTSGLSFSITDVVLNIPGDTSTPFTAEIIYPTTGSDYDVIAPKPPENIKQIDFLKSIMQLFNLYAYTEIKNPKHLIFQKYDEFYAYADADKIIRNSIDWTDKVDYENFKIISNVTLPKNYYFTYKEDSDWINDKYNSRFNQVYGTFNFTDKYGVEDEQKIELVFSATPVMEFVGTNRKLPALYSGDSLNKSATSTNIRILYYNGQQPCTRFEVWTDEYISSTAKLKLNKSIFPSQDYYAATSPYYYDSNHVPIETLDFGRVKEYFFPATSDYINAKTAYTNYYLNQTSELTNVNIFKVEAQVWLNEFDISKLDLKVPVFIDMGEFGHAYFKLLSVEYNDNKTSSLCTFQKIYLGTLK